MAYICSGTPTEADHYRGVDMVFTGTVTAREQPLPPHSDEQVRRGTAVMIYATGFLIRFG